jgi:hypothetical protein
MLGILTMAGNALRSLGSVHPVITWVAVTIVGLLAFGPVCAAFAEPLELPPLTKEAARRACAELQRENLLGGDPDTDLSRWPGTRCPRSARFKRSSRGATPPASGAAVRIHGHTHIRRKHRVGGVDVRANFPDFAEKDPTARSFTAKLFF